MSAPQRITKEELLEEFSNDKINCGYEQGWRYSADYVDDTFTDVHATFNRILDERLSRIEKVLSELH
jgi:hypothetical protein